MSPPKEMIETVVATAHIVRNRRRAYALIGDRKLEICPNLDRYKPLLDGNKSGPNRWTALTEWPAWTPEQGGTGKSPAPRHVDKNNCDLKHGSRSETSAGQYARERVTWKINTRAKCLEGRLSSISRRIYMVIC